MQKERDVTYVTNQNERILANTLEKSLRFYNAYHPLLKANAEPPPAYYIRDDGTRTLSEVTVSRQDLSIAKGMAVGAYNELAFDTEIDTNTGKRTRTINPYRKKIADDIVAKLAP